MFSALSRRVVRASLVLSAAAALAPASAQEKVVNVYNWSDYIDPAVLEAFTKETGIKVVYDTYDNNEIVETKLMAGIRLRHRRAVRSLVQRLAAAGVLAKLDQARLPNLKNMWPEITDRLKVLTPATPMP